MSRRIFIFYFAALFAAGFFLLKRAAAAEEKAQEAAPPSSAAESFLLKRAAAAEEKAQEAAPPSSAAKGGSSKAGKALAPDFAAPGLEPVKKEAASHQQPKPGLAGTDLSLKGSHFLSDSASPLARKNYYSLYGSLLYKKKKGRLFFKADAFAEKSLDSTRQFYAQPRELFLSYRYDFQNRRFVDSLTVHFGRHVKEWSRADAYWEFGAWNPLILYEPLSPSPAGLTGAFLDIASKNQLLEFYAGGFYMPHVKPKLLTVPGTNKISSPSRFADIPPESVNLAGRPLDIEYSVQFFKERLLHDSYGVSWTWMSAPPAEKRRFYLKGSFGWKPPNDIFLTRNTQDTVKIDKESKSSDSRGSALFVDQKIENQTVRQRILSLESGGRLDEFFGWVSLMQNKMSLSRALPPGREFVISPLDHSYISALAGRRLFLFQDIKTKIQAGWLHSFGLGRKANFEGQLISHKLLNGFGLDLIAAVGGEGAGLSAAGAARTLSLRYWLSPKTWSGFLSLNFLFYLFPKWRVSAGVNILTGRKPAARSFLSRFRSADSVFWRTSYVF